MNCSQVGWPSEGKQPKILVQYNVCHSKSLANTFYSSHSLYGLALASTATSGLRPSNFKEGKGFYGVTSPSTDYSLRSQELTFIRLLGPRHQQQNFLEFSNAELAQQYPCLQLYISTSTWVLCTPSAGQNMLYHIYANPVFWVPVSWGKVLGVLRPLPNR